MILVSTKLKFSPSFHAVSKARTWRRWAYVTVQVRLWKGWLWLAVWVQVLFTEVSHKCLFLKWAWMWFTQVFLLSLSHTHSIRSPTQFNVSRCCRLKIWALQMDFSRILCLYFNCLARISSLRLSVSRERAWFWVSWHALSGFGTISTPLRFAFNLDVSREVSWVSSSSEKQPGQNHYDI